MVNGFQRKRCSCEELSRRCTATVFLSWLSAENDRCRQRQMSRDRSVCGFRLWISNFKPSVHLLSSALEMFRICWLRSLCVDYGEAGLEAVRRYPLLAIKIMLPRYAKVRHANHCKHRRKIDAKTPNSSRCRGSPRLNALFLFMRNPSVRVQSLPGSMSAYAISRASIGHGPHHTRQTNPTPRNFFFSRGKPLDGCFAEISFAGSSCRSPSSTPPCDGLARGSSRSCRIVLLLESRAERHSKWNPWMRLLRCGLATALTLPSIRQIATLARYCCPGETYFSPPLVMRV